MDRNEDVEVIVERIYDNVMGRHPYGTGAAGEALWLGDVIKRAMTTAFAEGALYGAANAATRPKQ
jgi:hypothetical protein